MPSNVSLQCSRSHRSSTEDANAITFVCRKNLFLSSLAGFVLCFDGVW